MRTTRSMARSILKKKNDVEKARTRSSTALQEKKGLSKSRPRSSNALQEKKRPPIRSPAQSTVHPVIYRRSRRVANRLMSRTTSSSASSTDRHQTIANRMMSQTTPPSSSPSSDRQQTVQMKESTKSPPTVPEQRTTRVSKKMKASTQLPSSTMREMRRSTRMNPRSSQTPLASDKVTVEVRRSKRINQRCSQTSLAFDKVSVKLRRSRMINQRHPQTEESTGKLSVERRRTKRIREQTAVADLSVSKSVPLSKRRRNTTRPQRTVTLSTADNEHNTVSSRRQREYAPGFCDGRLIVHVCDFNPPLPFDKCPLPPIYRPYCPERDCTPLNYESPHFPSGPNGENWVTYMDLRRATETMFELFEKPRLGPTRREGEKEAFEYLEYLAGGSRNVAYSSLCAERSLRPQEIKEEPVDDYEMESEE